MWQSRLLHIVKYAAAIVAAGLLYAVFVGQTGIAVPCLFHLVTGLKCPGCGVTDMCMALLHLDFKAAFSCNPMLFLLLPPLALIFLKYLSDYVRSGIWKMNRVQTAGLYGSIALLCLFGAARNLPGL